MEAVANADGEQTRPCNPHSAEKAYHHGTEIWYPQGMGPGAGGFRLCRGEPRDEDMECSDQLTFKLQKTKQYLSEHRIYFGERVQPQFPSTFKMITIC
jgi:hypothetical protein